MNILLLTRYFSKEVGGGYYLFSIIAKLLAKNGHKVWVITNKVKGIENPKHDNIKIIFLSSQSINEIQYWSQKDKIRYFLLAIRKGLGIVKKEKIDVIHSNAIYPIFAGSILSALTSTPHIKTIHDLHSLEIKNSSSEGGLRKFLEKIMIKSVSSAIHTVSDATKDDLIKFGATKPIYVIPIGIPIKKVEEIQLEPYQLVCIGRLAAHKNIQVAIKAIKIVKKSFPKVSLIIIGDGEYKKNLQQLVDELDLQDNVVFKDQTSEGEKIKLLASSQALLFPSLIEGFGIVILEAFMQKKPVLVSNLSPMTDIVEHEKTGLIVPINDEKTWAKFIESVLRDPRNAQNMGEVGRKVFEERYGDENMTRKMTQIYEEIIKDSKT